MERLYAIVRGGRLPNEMVKKSSFFHSSLTVQGLVRVAAIAQLEGVDLWRWRQEKGNSILVCPPLEAARLHACKTG
jgi:hypothetical protein